MPDLEQAVRFGAIDWAKDAHAVSIVDERGADVPHPVHRTLW